MREYARSMGVPGPQVPVPLAGIQVIAGSLVEQVGARLGRKD